MAIQEHLTFGNILGCRNGLILTNTDSERAAKALAELEKAFDMPYMGTDRCDDATRKYLRDNIDKAKLGDPSGFTECIQANYAD